MTLVLSGVMPCGMQLNDFRTALGSEQLPNFVRPEALLKVQRPDRSPYFSCGSCIASRGAWQVKSSPVTTFMQVNSGSMFALMYTMCALKDDPETQAETKVL